MDEIKIKELWQASNDKMEQSLSLIQKNTEDITKMKVQTLLSSMKPIKIFTIVIGLLWVGLGSVILINLFMNAFNQVSLFFLFSASIQVFLTAIALVIYVYQLVLIHQIDISGPILETQEKLTRLKSSTLWVTRFLFLQLPVWTTFYLSEGMFKKENFLLLLIQVSMTLLLTLAAIWLFVNIKYENKDKKWFQLIFNGKEWDPVMKSIKLFKELKAFKGQ